MKGAIGTDGPMPRISIKAASGAEHLDGPASQDHETRMIPPHFDRIKIRVLLLGMIPALILALCFMLLQVAKQRDNHRAVHQHLAANTGELFAAAAVQGALIKDRELLRIQISPLFERSRAASAVRIFDPAGNTTLALERPVSPASQTTIPVDIPLTAPDGRDIGRLELEYRPPTVPSLATSELLLSLLLLIPALAAAWWFGRSLTKPLEAILDGVSRMKKGDFSTRVQLSSSGELSSLERGFNAMARELENARKKMKKKIDRATGDLTQTMEELEIKNVELDLARRRALDASRVKSEFLANMSHEIRTPMHGVLGFTNLLLKSDLSQEQRHLVKNISRSASGLLGIINNILDYSKLEYENIRPVNAPFDVEQCCDEAIAMLAPQAHEKALELVLLFYSDVPRELIGDEVRIRQVLINLLSNAVKFTDEGEVVLRVMVEEEEDNRCTLLFSLTDTGIGISPNEQKKLFQTFHQADPSARRRFGGTGLGLSICRKLVESMGGEIGMTSELNEGSAFFVSLTLTKPGEARAAPASPSFRGHHALVLGNHRLLTLSAAHRLRALGLRVTEGNLHAPPGGEGDDIEVAVLVASSRDLQSGVITSAAASWSSEQRCPLMLLLSTSEQEVIDDFEETFQALCCSTPVSRDQLAHALSRVFDGDDLEETLVLNRDQRDALAAGRRVLVVDDNPINLELMSALLRDRGIAVTAVNNGLDAIREAETTAYDLIVMDIHMPDVSGIDAANRIRADEEHLGRRTPIVALTADITPATRDRVSEAGMDACLVKPLDEIKFWNLFAALLKGAPAPEQEGAADETPETAAPEQETASEELAVHDRDEALRITGGKRDLADRMLHQFMDELDEQWRVIEEHFQARDYPRLGQVVHRMKGGGSICALPAFTAAAERLEKTAKSDDERQITECFNRLEAEVKRLRKLPIDPPTEELEHPPAP